jgi:Family of unknown function (DUF6152)
MKLASIALAAAVLATYSPAFAHHSFAAAYFEGQSIKLDGKVTAFLFRNPHSFVEMETVDAQGIATKWVAEWYSSGRLARVDITPDTFKPGDHVIITGAPGRETNDHRVHLKTIDRPSDGLHFDWMARDGGTKKRR